MMCVQLQCAIVRAIGRSTGALEVFSERNGTHNHVIDS